MNKQWSVSGNNLYPVETTNILKTLDNVVYTLECDQFGNIFLSMMQKEFSFPYKIYGTESEFIKRTIKTFKNTTNNLGILLNGIKGTGKTVTAQQICNQLEMTVIIIKRDTAGLIDFISNIQQDITVFIDEFEKVFPRNDDNNDESEALLTILDGVLKTKYRRVYLFTTNNVYINDNFLERPSRIRYRLEFKDLSKEVIIEIVDDLLIHKQFREDLITFISTLRIITVDVVKSLIEEVNIHEEAPDKFKNIFNVKVNDNRFDIFEGDISKTPIAKLKPVSMNAKLNPNIFEEESDDLINDNLSINGHFQGYISEVRGNVVVFKHNNSAKEKSQTYTIFRAIHQSFL